MKKRTIQLFSVLMAAIVLLSSCASSTMLSSNPAGATVYLDQAQIGVTPFTYSDTKISGAKTNLRLSLSGYSDLYVTIKKDELNAGRLVVGLFLWWPTLIWCTEYQGNYLFNMIKIEPDIN